MNKWELEEARKLRMENQYVRDFNAFQWAVDDHVSYCLGLAIVCIVCFMFGLVIGFFVIK